jgi:four helix bundle protein
LGIRDWGLGIGEEQPVTHVESYKQLDVWQYAMDLAAAVYELTEPFPHSEQFGLTAQMRRASVSIASNIAEGHRRTRPAYIHHVQIALGSLAEVETQLLLAVRLRFCTNTQAVPVQALIDPTGKMLHSLLRSLRS